MGGGPTLLLPFLLTQERKNRGEIFTGITTCAHHAVNLMGQGTEGDRSFSVSGCVLSESEILEKRKDNYVQKPPLFTLMVI